MYNGRNKIALMPTPSQVNLSKLSAMLRTKRGEKGLRTIAGEIGNVSASTLSRVEQGHLPDLDTFIRICRWLGVEPSAFMTEGAQTTQTRIAGGPASDTPQLIEAHFRAEKVLPLETITALSKMIHLAYNAANGAKLGKTKK